MASARPILARVGGRLLPLFGGDGVIGDEILALGFRPLEPVLLGQVVEVNRRQRTTLVRIDIARVGEAREGLITHGQHAADMREPSLDGRRSLVFAAHTIPVVRAIFPFDTGATDERGEDALLLARGELLLREVAPLAAVLRVPRPFHARPAHLRLQRFAVLAGVDRRPRLALLPLAAVPPWSSAHLRRRWWWLLGEHARHRADRSLTERHRASGTTDAASLAFPGPRPGAERPLAVRVRRRAAILRRHPIDHDVTVRVGAVGVLHDEGLPVVHAKRLQAAPRGGHHLDRLRLLVRCPGQAVVIDRLGQRSPFRADPGQRFEHGGIAGRPAHHRGRLAGLAVGQVLNHIPPHPLTRFRMAVAGDRGVVGEVLHHPPEAAPDRLRARHEGLPLVGAHPHPNGAGPALDGRQARTAHARALSARWRLVIEQQ